MKIETKFTPKTTLKEFTSMCDEDPLSEILNVLKFLTFSIIMMVGYYVGGGILSAIWLLIVLTLGYTISIPILFITMKYIKKWGDKI